MEAARSQLRTAIQLWISESDPVSTHALAYASHEIIHKLYRKRGLKGLLYDSEAVPQHRRKEFAEMLKKEANFIKHSNSGKDEAIEFRPEASGLFLMMSIVGLGKMGEELGDEEIAFLYWMSFCHPAWGDAEGALNDHFPVNVPDKLRRFGQSIGRAKFFKIFLEIRKRKRIGRN